MKSILIWFVLLCCTSAKVAAYSLADANGKYLQGSLLTATSNSALSPYSALDTLNFAIEPFSESQRFSDKVFWHRMDFVAPVNDPRPHTVHLKLANYMLDQLNFYLFRNDQLIQQWQRGDRQVWHPEPEWFDGIWIPIELTPGSRTTLLIRKQSAGPLITPIALYTDEHITTARNQVLVIWAGAVSALLVLLLYNIFVYSLFRYPAFAYYLGLNTALILSLGVVMGYANWMLPSTVSRWLAANIDVIHGFAAWCLFRFSLLFLRVQRWNPTFWKRRFILDALIWVFILFSFVVSEQVMSPIFLVYQVSLSALCLYWGIQAYRLNVTAARFYLISWSLFIIGATAGAAIYFTLLPFNRVTEHLYLACTLLELLGFSFAFADHARHSEQNRRQQLLTDPNSGLPNRLYYFGQLFRLLNSRRNKKQDVALILIQITTRSTLSQAFGPAKADFAIRQLVLNLNLQLMELPQVLSLPLPNGDHAKLMQTGSSTVAFISGEPGRIGELIHAIAHVLERPIWIEHFDYQHQFSIGVSRYPSQSQSLDTLYQQAQIAGRINQSSPDDWTDFDASYQSNQSQRLQLITYLTKDIREGRLEFQIQPQLHLSDGRLLGGEVLVRWHHQELGPVSPAEFVPLAEQTGLIFKLTQLMLNKVFHWIAAHPQVVRNGRLSINISALDMLQEGFATQVINQAESARISPKDIVLEVTETSIFEDNDAVVTNVTLLHKAGFHLSIDDFGAGYSSMQNLLVLSPQEIKIDRLFISQILNNSMHQTLCRSLIHLSHDLKLLCVAEGIEDEETRLMLQKWGCHAGQGYGLHRPMAPTDYLALVSQMEADVLPLKRSSI